MINTSWVTNRADGGAADKQSPFPGRKCARRALLILATSMAVALQLWTARAVTLTWGTTTGTWDTTTPNWTGSTGRTTWPALSSGTDTAIFGSPGGTVTLSGTITADALTFNGNGYTITGGTSLFLDGAMPTITTASGVSAAINSVISGTTGFTKAGTGTLVVTVASTETGAVVITQGALQLNSGASFANASSVAVQNATLILNDSASGVPSFANTFPLNNLVLNNATVTTTGAGFGDAGSVFSKLVTFAGSNSIMEAAGNNQRVIYFNAGIAGSGTESLIVQGNNPAIVIQGDDAGFSGTLVVPSVTTGNVSIQATHGWGVGSTLVVAGKVSVNTNTGAVPGSFRFGQNVVELTSTNRPVCWWLTQGGFSIRPSILR